MCKGVKKRGWQSWLCEWSLELFFFFFTLTFWAMHLKMRWRLTCIVAMGNMNNPCLGLETNPLMPGTYSLLNCTVGRFTFQKYGQYSSTESLNLISNSGTALSALNISLCFCSLSVSFLQNFHWFDILLVRV